MMNNKKRIMALLKEPLLQFLLSMHRAVMVRQDLDFKLVK